MKEGGGREELEDEGKVNKVLQLVFYDVVLCVFVPGKCVNCIRCLLCV